MSVRRIPKAVSIVVFSIVTIGTMLLLWVGLVFVLFWLDAGSVEVDQDDLALVQSRLEPARRALDALTAPADTRPDGPAEISGCTEIDSGWDVSDPAATRSWQVLGSAPPGAVHDGFEPTQPTASRQEIAAVADIVSQLERLGWVVGPGSRGDTETTLVLDRGTDTPLQITVSSFWGSLLAEASATPSGICHLD